MALVSLGAASFTISSIMAFRSSPMGWDASRVTAGTCEEQKRNPLMSITYSCSLLYFQLYLVELDFWVVR